MSARENAPCRAWPLDRGLLLFGLGVMVGMGLPSISPVNLWRDLLSSQVSTDGIT
jgi:hypothetical protein